jgi:hypothetical protein
MRKRIDRYIEDALINFRDWYISSSWLGKEHDCVNIFAHNFLANGIEPGAAISKLGQIRIESAVPQPTGYKNKTARKDLVIWKKSYDTVWDSDWSVSKYPWVVMEWKTKRKGAVPQKFSSHDLDWLSGYTEQHSDTFGYLVRVYGGPRGRSVDWAKVRRGNINGTNKRS